MKSDRIALPLILILTFLLPVFYGCPGSGTPKITLTVTDCPVDQITITDATTVRSISGGQWIMNAKIIVKCGREVVKNAEIKVEFWWPNGTYKLTTNENGEATYSKRGQGSPPYGEKFQVTIKGKDDDKEVEFEIKRNN